MKAIVAECESCGIRIGQGYIEKEVTEFRASGVGHKLCGYCLGEIQSKGFIKTIMRSALGRAPLYKTLWADHTVTWAKV